MKRNVSRTRIGRWGFHELDKLPAGLHTVTTVQSIQVSYERICAVLECRYLKGSHLSRVIREVICAYDENKKLFRGCHVQRDLIKMADSQIFQSDIITVQALYLSKNAFMI